MAAKGKGYGGWLVAAILVLIFLVSTNTWNPFPDMWTWVNTSGSLSRPDPVWQQRVGGPPDSTTMAGGALVVEQHTSVDGRRISDGTRLWSRKADWSAVAGSGTGSAAVMGRLLTKGYDVVDPATGTVLRHDGEAVAVWTYREAILDVRCRRAKQCTLTAWPPRGNTPLWLVDIPSVGFVLFADNPKLQGIHPLTASRAAPQPGGPEPMPRLLGFPIGQTVYLVDTANGRARPEVKPGRYEQAVAVGGRVLRITATPGDGGCYFTVDGRDAVTGGEVWREGGVNLRTVSGSGCQQRRTPAGAGNVVAGVAADGREALLDAYDGRALWVGKAGEKVLAVDNEYALIRAADGKSVKGMQLGRGTPMWTRPVSSGAQAALTEYAAVILDKGPDRIIALDPETGAERLNVRSDAKVFACGPDGMVVGEVREVGYLPYQLGKAG